MLRSCQPRRKGEEMGAWNVTVRSSIEELLKGAAPGWIAEGIAVPERFTVTAEKDDARATIDVVLRDRRLWARRVCVESDSDRGVTAAAVRDVAILPLMLHGARGMVLRAKVGPKGIGYTPADEHDEEAIAALQAAVGYAKEARKR
jgi:hypothetical protein